MPGLGRLGRLTSAWKLSLARFCSRMLSAGLVLLGYRYSRRHVICCVSQTP